MYIFTGDQILIYSATTITENDALKFIVSVCSVHYKTPTSSLHDKGQVIKKSIWQDGNERVEIHVMMDTMNKNNVYTICYI